MLVTDIDGIIVQPYGISIATLPFWVRLYNLPLDCRSEKHMWMIGNSFGEVLEIDFDGIDWDISARLKGH